MPIFQDWGRRRHRPGESPWHIQKGHANWRTGLIRSTRWARPESAAPGTGEERHATGGQIRSESPGIADTGSRRQSTQNRRERHSQIRRSGQARPGTVRCGLWAGPILQGFPSVAGVVRRHDSSIGCNNAERHSTVCHPVKGSTDEVRVAERSNPQNNTNGRRMKWREARNG
jgi:hypothetical protein